MKKAPLLILALSSVLASRPNYGIPNDGRMFQRCRDMAYSNADLEFGACREVTSCEEEESPLQHNSPIHVGVFVHESLERLELLLAGLLAKGHRVSLFVASQSLEDLIGQNRLLEYLPCEYHSQLMASVIVAALSDVPDYAEWESCETPRCRRIASCNFTVVKEWLELIQKMPPLTAVIGSHDTMDWKLVAQRLRIPALVVKDSNSIEERSYIQRVRDYFRESAVFWHYNRVRRELRIPLARTLDELYPEHTFTLDNLKIDGTVQVQGDWVPPCIPCRPEHDTLIQKSIHIAGADSASPGCKIPVVLVALPTKLTRRSWVNMMHALTMARRSWGRPTHQCDAWRDFVVLVVHANRARRWPSFVTNPTPPFVELVPLTMHQFVAVIPHDLFIVDCAGGGSMGEKRFCWDFDNPNPRENALKLLQRLRKSIPQEDLKHTSQALDDVTSYMFEWQAMPSHRRHSPWLWTVLTYSAFAIFSVGLLWIRSGQPSRRTSRIVELEQAVAMVQLEWNRAWKDAQACLPPELVPTPATPPVPPTPVEHSKKSRRHKKRH